MTIEELIKTLSELPPQTKVLIRGEFGLYDLSKDDIEYRNMFIVWHSDYNNNGVPFTDYSYEPASGVYVRGNGSPDYIYKTIGEEFVVSLG